MVLKNYIVRIYRFEKNNPRNLVGFVEESGFEERKAFTNLDELWDILTFRNFRKQGKESKHLH